MMAVTICICGLFRLGSLEIRRGRQGEILSYCGFGIMMFRVFQGDLLFDWNRFSKAGYSNERRCSRR